MYCDTSIHELPNPTTRLQSTGFSIYRMQEEKKASIRNLLTHLAWKVSWYCCGAFSSFSSNVHVSLYSHILTQLTQIETEYAKKLWSEKVVYRRTNFTLMLSKRFLGSSRPVSALLIRYLSLGIRSVVWKEQSKPFPGGVICMQSASHRSRSSFYPFPCTSSIVQVDVTLP